MAAIEALAPRVVGPRPRRGPRRPRRGLAAAHRRFAAALARPGEGRHPSGHRRASSTRSGTCGQGRGQAAVAAARRPHARAARQRSSTSSYLTDALDPGRARASCSRSAPPAGRARAAEMRARRLPRLHDLGRLARLRRRQGRAGSRARRSPTGWNARQDEGRRPDPRTTRRRAAIIREEIGSERQADDGRQPGLGRRRGDRAASRALAEFEPVLDRGADQPRRRPRPRRHRRGDRADPGRHRRALP